jgi:hypothetical protein
VITLTWVPNPQDSTAEELYAARLAQRDLAVFYDILVRRAATTIKESELGGMTLTPGVYKFQDAKTCDSQDVSLSADGVLTLDARGDPDAEWVLQVIPYTIPPIHHTHHHKCIKSPTINALTPHRKC